LKESIEKELHRLADKFSEHGEDIGYYPGVRESVIEEVERLTGLEFGEDLRALYKEANGCNGYTNLLFQSPEYEELCELSFYKIEEAYSTWNMFNPYDKMHYEEWELEEGDRDLVDKRVKPYLHHQYWWPIASGANMELYYDFDPTPDGKRGQIIAYIHDPDFIYYISGSLNELMVESYNQMDQWFRENSEENHTETETVNEEHRKNEPENIFEILESQGFGEYKEIENHEEELRITFPEFLRNSWTSYGEPICASYEMENGFDILIRTSSIHEKDTLHAWFEYFKGYLTDNFQEKSLKISKIDKIEIDGNEAYSIEYGHNDYDGRPLYKKSVFVYAERRGKAIEITLQYNKKFDKGSTEFIDKCFRRILDSIKFFETDDFNSRGFINNQYTPVDYSIKNVIENEYQKIKFEIPRVFGIDSWSDIRAYGDDCTLEIKSSNLDEKELFKARVDSYKYQYEKYFWKFKRKVNDVVDMYGVSAEHIGYYGDKKEYHIYIFKKKERYYWITLEFTLNSSIERTRKVIDEVLESIKFI